MTRLLRSVLYLPASNLRAIEKAKGLACDAVILDLEDSVAPDQKALARQQAAEALKSGDFGQKLVAIRVNGLDTAWGAEDCAVIAPLKPEVIVAPKVDDASQLAAYGQVAGGARLWALIETCKGVLNLRDMIQTARAARLSALIAGVNDLAKEMRCLNDPARTALQPVLSQMIVAARAAGLSVLDGVYNALEDQEGLLAECHQGRMLGFDGKTLIHPRQVEAANLAFSPSEDELAWARAIISAFDQPENADKGAIRLDGRMVERLHLIEAKRMLEMVDLGV